MEGKTAEIRAACRTVLTKILYCISYWYEGEWIFLSFPLLFNKAISSTEWAMWIPQDKGKPFSLDFLNCSPCLLARRILTFDSYGIIQLLLLLPQVRYSFYKRIRWLEAHKYSFFTVHKKEQGYVMWIIMTLKLSITFLLFLLALQQTFFRMSLFTIPFANSVQGWGKVLQYWFTILIFIGPISLVRGWHIFINKTMLIGGSCL